ncbi:MAG: aldose epimerase family protein [Bacteroidales bacterium]
MTISEKKYGTAPGGEDIFLYTIEATAGVKLTFCNIGAAIVSICIPDKNGKAEDVVLGYDNLLYYIGDGPCFGKIPGRVANRIEGGRFELNGKTYTLPINNGPNHNHGGNNGYANRIWKSKIDAAGVLFTLTAPDGDDGYPGAVQVQVRYKWVEGGDCDQNKGADCALHGHVDGQQNAGENIGKLIIELSGNSADATVLNLTNHAYFNLKGEGNGLITDHILKLAASRYLPTDETLIPTGKLASVAGTPMDFTKDATIGSRMEEEFPALRYGKGYDACWAVDNWNGNPSINDCSGNGSVKCVAELSSKESGRKLNVYSDQPGVIIYTGNWLGGCNEGKKGHVYTDYSGVAIECQKFPAAPNRPSFPSIVLQKGERYANNIVFEFATV